ncbi:MAG: hypothetical protein MUE72_04105 [Chitinophagaceae bacterium]|jgi:hypothetical protein|nr:hypothetical protein [Chitinophagaceae bacterium]
MKKIFIIVLCFVLLNKATAQADKVLFDNVFQNINKSTIPTGYLQESHPKSPSRGEGLESQHPPEKMGKFL